MLEGDKLMEDKLLEDKFLDLIKHRRSIRRYEKRQIGEKALTQILEAGLYAPSAGGGQRCIFVVSQDAIVNEKLGRIKRGNSTPKMATKTSYVSKEQPSIADDPNIKNAFYDAPTVITIFGPKDFLFTPEDCAVAAENMMLMADVLHIGSCYIGQGWTAFDDPFGIEILKQWKIDNNYYAVMQLLLGYSCNEDRHPMPKERKGNRIIRV